MLKCEEMLLCNVPDAYNLHGLVNNGVGFYKQRNVSKNTKCKSLTNIELLKTRVFSPKKYNIFIFSCSQSTIIGSQLAKMY